MREARRKEPIEKEEVKEEEYRYASLCYFFLS